MGNGMRDDTGLSYRGTEIGVTEGLNIILLPVDWAQRLI